MKKICSLTLLLNVAAVAGGMCVVPAHAQLPTTGAPVVNATDQAAQWEKLQQVNSAAKSIHVVWHCVRRLKARPDADPEAPGAGDDEVGARTRIE